MANSELNNYISDRKASLPSRGRPAMVMTHVVCGYPSFEDNWKELQVMHEFGVDLVELQFPFSEPSADGPLFVKANQEAISKGVSVDDCFNFMKKVTEAFSFKVVMMGYFNTIFKTGQRTFLERLKEAGGHGFIVPDLPIEEARILHEIAAELELSPIVLMTPTNSDERLAELALAADGFVYTVARKGVTGTNTDMNSDLAEFIDRCKAKTDVPLAVGFGITTAEDVAFIGKHADIAVIGTAALKAWETGGETSLRGFFTQLLN
ncbi:MAG: tryptophan synthase subunit alpha [Gammaproteobacteria bacterium]|nr:tryptophan synthase subunit alpha [Gammaproteobacteria bacterium]